MYLAKRNEQLPGKPQCPTCSAVLDGYTHVDLEERKMPPGSKSICIYCSSALVYDGSSFRKMTEEELFEARCNPNFRRAEEAVRQLRERKSPWSKTSS